MRLAGAKRDMKLAVELESFVHIISFEPRRIELRLNDAAPGDLVGRLLQRLRDWTGEQWIVTLNTSEDGAATLRDARYAEVMADPLVKEAFAVFPDAEILAIREPRAPDLVADLAAGAAPDDALAGGDDADMNDDGVETD